MTLWGRECHSLGRTVVFLQRNCPISGRNLVFGDKNALFLGENVVFVERNFPVFVRNVVFCGENVLGSNSPILGTKQAAVLWGQRHVLGRKWYVGEKTSRAERSMGLVFWQKWMRERFSAQKTQ